MINALIRTRLFTINELRQQFPSLHRMTVMTHRRTLGNLLTFEEVHKWIEQNGILFSELGEGIYPDQLQLQENPYTDTDGTVYTHLV